MLILLNDYNALSRRGLLKQNLPSSVLDNLNPRFAMRAYQQEALNRFQYYLQDDPDRKRPAHLLFHMATGSGKTLLMAANILYLYGMGYRNFIFFVNSKNIIKKTQANFLDKGSIKYLFADKVIIKDREVAIKEVENFEAANPDNINILFTTIQGLHSRLNLPQENSITYEDFKDLKVAYLSDEAHHINALTRQSGKYTTEEAEEVSCWENTVDRIFKGNPENIMLEYTATVELDNLAIQKKYADKIVFQYTLKEFREDKFSKDVRILQGDISPKERVLQAILLSQYRRKVAEKHKVLLKPVVFVKSKTITESKEFQKEFSVYLKTLTQADIKRLESHDGAGVIKDAFKFFKREAITPENLIHELQQDFSEEKCVAVNSEADSEEKQILVNTLEAEHNEVRLIFAVNMLNEGWDVLNLFDIVRLYDTRDREHVTISEAQLIGRGARYYPFKLSRDQEAFKRKYDAELKNELRILEELHYHCISEHRYISEITSALIKTGIKPPDENRRVFTISVKDAIKKTDFWKNGLLFLNERKKNDFGAVRNLKDIISETAFSHKLRTGFTAETEVFADGAAEKPAAAEGPRKKALKFTDIEKQVIQKAMDRVEFYRFSNLRRYFPALLSLDEFITSEHYLAQVTVDVYGKQEHIFALSSHSKLEIAIHVLNEIAGRIGSNISEYIGTKEFKAHSIASRIPTLPQKMEVLIGGEDKEFGVAMSNTLDENLRLDLKRHDWYIFDENYGTDQEKLFIQFIRNAIDDLSNKYTNIYLLRNEKIFRIYRFSDGKALEPDFVLFMTEKESGKAISYQLFVEPKGQHLVKTDQWKEEFLKDIEVKYELEPLYETSRFKIIGMPFYNEEGKKQEFTQAFERFSKS